MLIATILIEVIATKFRINLFLDIYIIALPKSVPTY